MKKLNKKFWILIGAVIVIIILIILFKGKKNKTVKADEDIYNEKFNISKTDTFFLKDSDTEGYALFSESGKKLTDFKYKNSQVKFLNHTMLVETLDGKKCALNDSGKIVIECGKYDKLSQKEALYVAEKDNKTIILNYKGKTVKEFSGYTSFDTFIDSNEFLLVKNDTKYYVIDFEGDIVYSFNEAKDASPTVNYTNGIASIFYSGKNYILDIKKNKKIFEAEDEYHLCVNSTDQKGNVVVLATCASWYQNIENKKYVIVNKGKETYNSTKDNSCKSIAFYQESLRCYTDNGIYLIDEKGKKVNEKDIRNMAFSSSKNYAINDKGEVVFYKNNKESKRVAGTLYETGYMKNEKVIVRAENGFMIYSFDGKPVTDTVFKNANSTYGKYYYGKIADDQYVFITEKNKLSDSYYKVIGNLEQYFNVQTEKDIYNVVDATTGKKILPDSKVAYSLQKKGDLLIAYLKTDDEKSLYNLETGKNIIKVNNDLNLYTNYFSIKKDGMVEYYSYINGKKFYERKDN